MNYLRFNVIWNCTSHFYLILFLNIWALYKHTATFRIPLDCKYNQHLSEQKGGHTNSGVGILLFYAYTAFVQLSLNTKTFQFHTEGFQFSMQNSRQIPPADGAPILIRRPLLAQHRREMSGHRCIGCADNWIGQAERHTVKKNQKKKPSETKPRIHCAWNSIQALQYKPRVWYCF